MNNEELFARSTQLTGDGTQYNIPTSGPTSRDGTNNATPSTTATNERDVPIATATQVASPFSISSQSNRPSTTTIVAEFDSIIEHFRKGKSLNPRQSNLSPQNLPLIPLKMNQVRTMHSSNTLPPSTPLNASLMSRLNVGPEPPQDLGDTEEHWEPLLLMQMKCTCPTSPPILIKENEGEIAMNKRTKTLMERMIIDDGESNRKKRLFERNMPWFQRE